MTGQTSDEVEELMPYSSLSYRLLYVTQFACPNTGCANIHRSTAFTAQLWNPCSNPTWICSRIMSEQSNSQQLRDEAILVSLTHFTLDIPSVVSSVKSPKAGAVVLFAGIKSVFPSYQLLTYPRNDQRQLRWQASHPSRILLLPAARFKYNALNSAVCEGEARFDGCRHGPSAWRGTNRRRKYIDCCICAAPTRSVEGRRGGVGAVQGEGRGVEA